MKSFSLITSSIYNEAEYIKFKNSYSASLNPTLDELYRLDTGDSKLKSILRKQLKTYGVHNQPFSFNNLKEAFNRTQTTLKDKYPESSTTSVQKQFAALLDKYYNRQYFQNLYIGNHCPDFFLPHYRHYKSNSAVVEIDGPIHGNTAKQKKDDHKENIFYEQFNIAVFRFQNNIVMNESTVNFVKSLNNYHSPDSKSSMRLWRKLFISTIAHHGNEAIFKNVFGINLAQFQELVDTVRNSKGL